MVGRESFCVRGKEVERLKEERGQGERFLEIGEIGEQGREEKGKGEFISGRRETTNTGRGQGERNREGKVEGRGENDKE